MRRFSSALSKPASAFMRSDLRGGFAGSRVRPFFVRITVSSQRCSACYAVVRLDIILVELQCLPAV